MSLRTSPRWFGLALVLFACGDDDADSCSASSARSCAGDAGSVESKAGVGGAGRGGAGSSARGGAGGSSGHGGAGAGAEMDASVAGHHAASGDDAGPQDHDDAGPTSPDGHYACHALQGYAYDCVDPWLDSAFQVDPYTWTLDLAADHLTIDSIGFDQAQIACDGTWTPSEFSCFAQWSRAGRVCDNTLHLKIEPNGQFTFSVGTRLEEVANCAR